GLVREGPATAEGSVQQEIEGVEVGQFVAVHGTDHSLEVTRHPARGDLGAEQVIPLGFKCDQPHVGGIALVTRTRVGQPEQWYPGPGHQSNSTLTSSSIRWRDTSAGQ